MVPGESMPHGRYVLLGSIPSLKGWCSFGSSPIAIIILQHKPLVDLRLVLVKRVAISGGLPKQDFLALVCLWRRSALFERSTKMHIELEIPGYGIIESVELPEDQALEFKKEIIKAVALDKGWISFETESGSVIVPNGVLMNSVIRIIK